MPKLQLNEQLTDKEILKFKIPNTLTISDFHGCQYAMCIGAILKDSNNKTIYKPEYSKQLIADKVPPNQLISFCERHKNIIIKDKVYTEGRFMTIYYIVYTLEEKPMLINDFKYFSRNQIDVELIFNENGLYRIEELHLETSPNTSVMSAIHTLFSNENISGLPFITTDNDNHYLIEYYDEYGKSKIYKYDTVLSIYNCITNIRLVGCKEIGMYDEDKID